MVKRFRFLPKPVKNREWIGEGREPLLELQGGPGGAAPPDGPRRKIPYIVSSAHIRSNFNTREFNSRELAQSFQLYSKRSSPFWTIFGHKIALFFL